jgi:hypothetical protein
MSLEEKLTSLDDEKIDPNVYYLTKKIHFYNI